MALSKPVPEHIAIIMDGNGRWAKKRGLPRNMGHKAGAETFRRIADYCKGIGVKYLTVYAFSTENWKRSQEEVAGIMRLLEEYLKEALRDMDKSGIRVRFFGDLTRLPPKLQTLCAEVAERSADHKDATVNFCINYGGRDEIIRAVRKYASDVAAGKAVPAQLTEAELETYLDSAGIPDPDLVIRPSGEQRTSNFLPWQTAYSELIFMDILWPDFSPRDIDAAIDEFHRRNRRFGGV